MKILLIGCGEMGSEALGDLQAHGGFDEIIVGTRTVAKADQVIAGLKPNGTRIHPVPVDAGDTDAVAALMNGCAAAVNCAGPNYKYELPIAHAAIKAGVHLVDINDEFEITFKMYELDDLARSAGIIIVLGLGGCPGIDNVLVRSGADQLDEVEKIRTAWVMSGSDPGGMALSYHLLYSLSGRALTFTEGKLVEVRSFIDGAEKIQFPDPVGEVEVFHVGHPEPVTLSRTFPSVRYVDNKASFNTPVVNDLIVRLGRLVREAPGPIRVDGKQVDAMDFAAAYLQQRCRELRSVPKEAALRVEVSGTKRGRRKKIVFSSYGRLARATGIPAAIGGIMCARGKVTARGVLPPEACIEPHDFLYEMIDRRHVAELNGWVEE